MLVEVRQGWKARRVVLLNVAVWLAKVAKEPAVQEGDGAFSWGILAAEAAHRARRVRAITSPPSRPRPGQDPCRTRPFVLVIVAHVSEPGARKRQAQDCSPTRAMQSG